MHTQPRPSSLLQIALARAAAASTLMENYLGRGRTQGKGEASTGAAYSGPNRRRHQRTAGLAPAPGAALLAHLAQGCSDSLQRACASRQLNLAQPLRILADEGCGLGLAEGDPRASALQALLQDLPDLRHQLERLLSFATVQRSMDFPPACAQFLGNCSDLLDGQATLEQYRRQHPLPVISLRYCDGEIGLQEQTADGWRALMSAGELARELVHYHRQLPQRQVVADAPILVPADPLPAAPRRPQHKPAWLVWQTLLRNESALGS